MKKVSIFCLSLALGIVSTHAERVGKIRVEGIRRVEYETVLSYLTIKPNVEFSNQDVDTALKRLFETGLFSDVHIFTNAGELIVRVAESPIINRISYDGNDKIADKTIEEQIKDRLAPRHVFKRSVVQEIARDIQRMYRAKGLFSAVVTPKIIRRPENRVDLVFEINEGAQAVVRRILFAGNKNFKDEELMDELSTKEEKWWRFWTYDDVYAPERLEVDKKAIRKFYQKNGYADCKILSSVGELTQDKKDFFITFTVEEGARFKVKSIKVKSEIKKVDMKKLQKCVNFKSGDWYNADLIEKTNTAMQEEVGSLGFAFADVEQDIQLDRKNNTAEITFTVKETPKVFVERFEIHGNSRTYDEVIRREIEIHEGDPLNTLKMNRSVQKVKDLDYFEDVNIQAEQGSTPDMQIVRMDVAEKSTGSFKFAAGIGTGGDGWSLMLGYGEKNLFGRGNMLNLDVMWGQRSQSASIGIVNPYMFYKNLIGGVTLETSRHNRGTITGWKSVTHAIDTYIGYAIAQDIDQKVGCKFSIDKISHLKGIRSDYSRLEKDRFGKTRCGAVYSYLEYRKQDSRRDPTKGYNVHMYNELAGVVGNVRYNKHLIGGGYYRPVTDNVTFISKITFGFINNGRIMDRFDLGGDNLRGFEVEGAGPRDKSGYRESVRGTRCYYGTFAMRVPLGASKELGLRGVVFVDYGALWNSKLPKSEVYDDKKMRASTGIGLEWFSPIGPITLNFSKPIKKQPYDRTQVFQLSGLMAN